MSNDARQRVPATIIQQYHQHLQERVNSHTRAALRALAEGTESGQAQFEGLLDRLSGQLPHEVALAQTLLEDIEQYGAVWTGIVAIGRLRIDVADDDDLASNMRHICRLLAPNWRPDRVTTKGDVHIWTMRQHQGVPQEYRIELWLVIEPPEYVASTRKYEGTYVVSDHYSEQTKEEVK